MLREFLTSLSPILMPLDRTWKNSDEYDQVISFFSMWWRLLFVSSIAGLMVGLAIPIVKPKFTTEIKFKYLVPGSNKVEHEPSRSLKIAFSNPFLLDTFAEAASGYWENHKSLVPTEVPFDLVSKPINSSVIKESLVKYINKTMLPALDQGIDIHNIPLLIYTDAADSYIVRVIASNTKVGEQWAPAIASGLDTLIAANNLRVEELDQKNSFENVAKDIDEQLEEEREILEGLIEQQESTISALQKRLIEESAKCLKLLNQKSLCTFDANRVYSDLPSISDTQIQSVLFNLDNLKVHILAYVERNTSIKVEAGLILKSLADISKELLLLKYTNHAEIYREIYRNKVMKIMQTVKQRVLLLPLPSLIPVEGGSYNISTTSPLVLRLGIWGVFGLFCGLMLAAAWAILYQRFRGRSV